ncbi:hypothetical protein AVEN_221722-1 [Araneus ventricosus]|uniref:Uncharacterized protein n=1 Tax=Araneus ventricosus TaxID=182803 RepID=A0A4Y2QRG0_ARAVE|nr:hypothetical protein AVEN_221722-1 [Araneus ventricosus]
MDLKCPGGRICARDWRVLGLRSDSKENELCIWAWCTLNLTSLASKIKHLPHRLAWRCSSKKGMMAQLLSSNHGSNLRVSSPNNSRVTPNGTLSEQNLN